ncbi:hypothetical protein N8702_00920 [Verrucomicrobia bacterium]|nr:hypothetical protein [Verrucomicrobiota bacterium]
MASNKNLKALQASNWCQLGKLTGYNYLLDIEDAPAVSSATYGASFDGSHALDENWSASYKAELAVQLDYGDNATVLKLSEDAAGGMCRKALQSETMYGITA